MSTVLARRIAAVDWLRATRDLDTEGVAVLPRLLNAGQCAALRILYSHAERFRSRVVMGRHGFGRGEYQYFAEPLPPLVQVLREMIYPYLAPLANAWTQRLREARTFPATHAEFRAQCRAADQCRPTPLLLRYGVGDYNCLHQDLYGELAFPLQVIVMLSAPGADYDGGELVLVEQLPRRQPRPRVVTLQRGEAAVIAVNSRPVTGRRGDYRVKLKHGVSTVLRGERYTLGVIFHDAR
ncbi:MAG: 2OG-Fe(II) oxygenase [Nitrococcus mobilis]|nr:2OG-Fe(II) oxygenase [Nitrococcus mobilis]